MFLRNKLSVQKWESVIDLYQENKAYLISFFMLWECQTKLLAQAAWKKLETKSLVLLGQKLIQVCIAINDSSAVLRR